MGALAQALALEVRVTQAGLKRIHMVDLARQAAAAAQDADAMANQALEATRKLQVGQQYAPVEAPEIMVRHLLHLH